MPRIEYLGLIFFNGIFQVKPDDLLPVGHQRGYLTVAKLEHIMYDLLLDFFENTTGSPLLDQTFNLFLCDRVLALLYI
ncbi:hypothetical protein D3C87_1706980 [compost metagenome]